MMPASSAVDEPSRFAQPGSVVRASFERVTEPQLDLPMSRFHAFADVPHALLIDLSDRSLTILQYGEPVRYLDVTIGANDTTPTGDFAIVTKLLDPDWYNRGRPVKAGDPSNPLGRHWLGLADGAGNRLPIGIHATTDVASIGQSASRGCVRLSVRDAEAVFRLSPIGTLVHICR